MWIEVSVVGKGYSRRTALPATRKLPNKMLIEIFAYLQALRSEAAKSLEDGPYRAVHGHFMEIHTIAGSGQELQMPYLNFLCDASELLRWDTS